MEISEKKAARNFYELYSRDISPRLREIDLRLREDCFPLTEEETAELLDISIDETGSWLAEKGLAEIDRAAFVRLMGEGSSGLCRLFRRELSRRSPYLYTREDIAYIYGLEQRAVDAACDALHMKEATEAMFPYIFEKIPV